MASYVRKKKKKQNRLAMFAIMLVVAVLLAVLSYQTVKLENRRDEYTKRLAGIEKQIEEQESRAADLEQQRIYIQTKQFIEEEAKDKLGMVYPDEIILQPKE